MTIPYTQKCTFAIHILSGYCMVEKLLLFSTNSDLPSQYVATCKREPKKAINRFLTDGAHIQDTYIISSPLGFFFK